MGMARFTETYYHGGDNNVWKEAWPGMPRGELEYLLETNEDRPDVARMEAFGAALEGAGTDWELVQVSPSAVELSRRRLAVLLWRNANEIC
jgi:hypothetical protein